MKITVDWKLFWKLIKEDTVLQVLTIGAVCLFILLLLESK